MDQSPLDILTIVISVTMLLLLFAGGTLVILCTRRASWRRRLAWAVVSLMPLCTFLLIHRFHERIFPGGGYWSRDNANPLPILVLFALNQGVRSLFQRTTRTTDLAASSPTD